MNKAIHGAIRRDLERFLDALEKFSDGDRARAGQLATAWTHFDFELTRHHEGEHEIAWPALAAVGVSKELIAAMDAEHDAMAAALTEARGEMAKFAASASAQDAQSARAAMTRLQEVTVSHLDHEEAELEPVYHAKKDTPEIKEMGKKFSKGPISQGGQWMAWMQDGATEEMKAAMTRDIPAPVVKIVGGIWGRSYRRNVAPVWKG